MSQILDPDPPGGLIPKDPNFSTPFPALASTTAAEPQPPLEPPKWFVLVEALVGKRGLRPGDRQPDLGFFSRGH